MANIETLHLCIESLSIQHAERIIKYVQNPAIYSYIPGDPPSLSDLTKRIKFLAGGKSPDGSELWLNWVLVLRESNSPVGTFQATINPQQASSIAYEIFVPYWRSGYGYEAAKAVVDHLFDRYPIPALTANIDTRNIASIKLVEKLGFENIDFLPDADFFKGASSDEFVYELKRTNWPFGIA